ncbi:mucin-2 [Saimiri boliviensis]|uniref:mucin-2 n=1 Tax=Saimiri boliviensis TaxID=27679 RepID=UPI003D7817C2
MGLPLACLAAICLALSLAGGSELQTEGRARDHGHSVCSAWGDFHYKTFDGDVFRFPGLCDYNFASDCKGSYKEFAVHLKRGPGQAGAPPRVESILLTIKDDTIYLTRHLAVLNGAVVSAPHYSPGLLIEKSDAYTKVYSRAGLALLWNREDAVMLELDSKFRNHTCGLCGDYNGLQSYSEFLSDGVLFSALEFGNMQKINQPDVECEDPEEEPAPASCAEHRAECERLLTAEAFADCQDRVPLEPYLRACQQDRCHCSGGDGDACVCSTVAEFSRQCSHAGGRPGNWRTASLCPKTCPGNLVYLESGSPCMDTCSHLQVSSLCEEHRMDGCFCPEGTVYDDIAGGGCVPVSQCHCRLHGHLYTPGQEITSDCEQCVCNAGRWVCKDLPCPGTCALEGGSHITTFDGKKFTFHGDCYYVLAKGDNDSYALLGELAPCGSTDKQTCLKTVVLLADGKKNVVVFKSDGSVLLNELQVNLPHVTASFSIFRPSSYHIVVSVAAGLRLQVQLAPVMQLFVTLDPAAQGQVQGLCGNFNGLEGDDFKTASGLVEATGAGFANTWKAQSSCRDKVDWLDDPCSLNIESATYAEHWCSLLKKTETPFGRCHSAVDPAEYYKRCKYDTCNCQNNEDCLCAALSSYARACAAKGVMLWGWRERVCNKDVGSCPSSQVFLYNLTTCQQTCRSLSEADSHCLEGFAPVDGCGCPDHTFLDEKGHCVPLAKCSCYHRGLYLEAGDVVVRQEERCVCRNGKLHCMQIRLLGQSCVAPKIHMDCNNLTALATLKPRALSCQTLAAGYYHTECVSGCVCPDGLMDDGRGGCVAEEKCPCVHNKDLYSPGDKIKVDCNTCTCQKGRWACSQAVCHGTCSIYGSGHYITFDGKYYDFDGHCSYVAVQDYCGQNSSLGSFSIITENVPCGTTGVTCSKAIKIFMGRTELKLEDKHRVVIQRDEGHHVAYTTREVGQYLVVESSTGIIVIWDKRTTVFIKLAPSYKGTVCGLCGNFDDRSNNDFTTRDHMVVSSELDFGNSWKEAPTCPDVSANPEPCSLNPHRRSWAEKQCSILKSSVFSICHSKVDPTPFYEACVHDSCSCDSGGDCECFCSAVASYAQECTKAEACVFWRTPDLCPIFCDYYNPPHECEWHYEPCGNRSFETCRTINGIHSNISVSYLEGCYPRCPKNRPIYDEDLKKCVSADECGCYIEDTHYPPGASVPTEEICKSCVCTNSSQVVCRPEAGKILNETQDGAFCYWEICGPNGTVEKHFNICVSTTPRPSTLTTFTTVTLPTTPTTFTTTTTTTTPTPSTEPCCHWSDWINEDHPSSGSDGGDRETIDGVCSAPQDIECRSVKEPHLSLEQLGQKVQCDLSVGFICKNEDQFGNGQFGLCYDYEIRVNCCRPECITPPPTATPSTPPTTTTTPPPTTTTTPPPTTTPSTPPTTTTTPPPTTTTTPPPTTTPTPPPTTTTTPPPTTMTTPPPTTTTTPPPTTTPTPPPTTTTTPPPTTTTTPPPTTTTTPPPTTTPSTPPTTTTTPPPTTTTTPPPTTTPSTPPTTTTTPPPTTTTTPPPTTTPSTPPTTTTTPPPTTTTTPPPTTTTTPPPTTTPTPPPTTTTTPPPTTTTTPPPTTTTTPPPTTTTTPPPTATPTPPPTTTTTTPPTTTPSTPPTTTTTTPPTTTPSTPSTTTTATPPTTTPSPPPTTTTTTPSTPPTTTTTTSTPPPTTTTTPSPTTTTTPPSTTTTTTPPTTTISPPSTTTTTTPPTTTPTPPPTTTTTPSPITTTTPPSTTTTATPPTATPSPPSTTTITTPSTTTTTTPSTSSSSSSTTPCVPICHWTGWLDSGKPNFTIQGGDKELIGDTCGGGWAANISCRAVMYPDVPIGQLGQTVLCNVSVGLVCKNEDQKPGGNIPMPFCLNYEINIQCCECGPTGPPPTATPSPPSTTKTITPTPPSTTTPTTPPTTASSPPTPSTPSTTTTTTPPNTTPSTPSTTMTTTPPTTTTTTPSPTPTTTTTTPPTTTPSTPSTTTTTPPPTATPTPPPTTTTTTPPTTTPSTPSTTTTTPPPTTTTTPPPTTTPSIPSTTTTTTPPTTTPSTPSTTTTTPPPTTTTTPPPTTTPSTPSTTTTTPPPTTTTTPPPTTTPSLPPTATPSTPSTTTTTTPPTTTSSTPSTTTTTTPPTTTTTPPPTTTPSTPSTTTTTTPPTTTPSTPPTTTTTTPRTTTTTPPPTTTPSTPPTTTTTTPPTTTPSPPPTTTTTPPPTTTPSTPSTTTTTTPPTTTPSPPPTTTTTTPSTPPTATTTTPSTPPTTTTTTPSTPPTTTTTTPSPPPTTTTTPSPTTTTTPPSTTMTTTPPTTTISPPSTTTTTTPPTTTPTPPPTTTTTPSPTTTTTPPSTTTTTTPPTATPSPPSTTTITTPSTTTTTTPSTSSSSSSTTPCVPICHWTGWLDSGKPNFTIQGGDKELIGDTCGGGWAANISCRAVMYPDVPIGQLGQTVLCNVSVGLVCKNEDQKPGGNIPMPFCLNYEINIQCCECGPTGPPPTATPSPPSTTTPSTPPTTTPSTPSTTTTTTPTTTTTTTPSTPSTTTTTALPTTTPSPPTPSTPPTTTTITPPTTTIATPSPPSTTTITTPPTTTPSTPPTTTPSTPSTTTTTTPPTTTPSTPSTTMTTTPPTTTTTTPSPTPTTTTTTPPTTTPSTPSTTTTTPPPTATPTPPPTTTTTTPPTTTPSTPSTTTTTPPPTTTTTPPPTTTPSIPSTTTTTTPPTTTPSTPSTTTTTTPSTTTTTPPPTATTTPPPTTTTTPPPTTTPSTPPTTTTITPSTTTTTPPPTTTTTPPPTTTPSLPPTATPSTPSTTTTTTPPTTTPSTPSTTTTTTPPTTTTTPPPTTTPSTPSTTTTTTPPTTTPSTPPTTTTTTPRTTTTTPPPTTTPSTPPTTTTTTPPTTTPSPPPTTTTTPPPTTTPSTPSTTTTTTPPTTTPSPPPTTTTTTPSTPPTATTTTPSTPPTTSTTTPSPPPTTTTTPSPTTTTTPPSTTTTTTPPTTTISPPSTTTTTTPPTTTPTPPPTTTTTPSPTTTTTPPSTTTTTTPPTATPSPPSTTTITTPPTTTPSTLSTTTTTTPSTTTTTTPPTTTTTTPSTPPTTTTITPPTTTTATPSPPSTTTTTTPPTTTPSTPSTTMTTTPPTTTTTTPSTPSTTTTTALPTTTPSPPTPSTPPTTTTITPPTTTTATPSPPSTTTTTTPPTTTTTTLSPPTPSTPPTTTTITPPTTTTATPSPPSTTMTTTPPTTTPSTPSTTTTTTPPTTTTTTPSTPPTTTPRTPSTTTTTALPTTTPSPPTPSTPPTTTTITPPTTTTATSSPPSTTTTTTPPTTTPSPPTSSTPPTTTTITPPTTTTATPSPPSTTMTTTPPTTTPSTPSTTTTTTPPTTTTTTPSTPSTTTTTALPTTTPSPPTPSTPPTTTTITPPTTTTATPSPPSTTTTTTPPTTTPSTPSPPTPSTPPTTTTTTPPTTTTTTTTPPSTTTTTALPTTTPSPPTPSPPSTTTTTTRSPPTTTETTTTTPTTSTATVTPTPTPTTLSTVPPIPTSTTPIAQSTTSKPPPESSAPQTSQSTSSPPMGSTTLLSTPPPATKMTSTAPPSTPTTPTATTMGGHTPSPPPGTTVVPPGTPTRATTTGSPSPTTPSTARMTTSTRTPTPTTVSTSSIITTTTMVPGTLVPCCVLNDTYYAPGEEVYNGTLGDTCYFVNCSLDCTLEIYNWSCPSTPSPTPTPSKPTPMPSKPTPTPSKPTPTPSKQTPSTKPPECPDFDPPRQENETWWLCDCLMATCKHNNTVEVTEVKCEPPPVPTCSNGLTPVRVVDDDRCCWHWECDCYCTGWGDPHYVTFDGLYYSYQGNCTYVLVEEISPTVDNFGVYIDNYHCDVNDRVSCPRTLIVRHETQEVLVKTVHMMPMRVQVQVNGQVVALPYKKYGLEVYQSGINYVVAVPELGALVSYNGLSFSIRLPYHKFGNNTKGQCGTCTNTTSDDCILPSGEIVSNCEAAADQWVVNDPSKPHCPHSISTTKRPAVTVPGGSKTTPRKDCTPSPLCQLIKDSLFSKCHALVPPQHYYEACVFDSCFVPGSRLECASLQAYAALCAQEGVCLDWRNHTHGACLVECPSHREYQACGPAEEPTCKSSSSQQNNTVPVEGCFCPEGTMNYAPGYDVCVKTCGCVGPDNVPREFGEHFEFDCKDCICLEGGSGIICQPKRCSQKPVTHCVEDGTYLVTEVDPDDTCCNISVCKCNTSLCKEEPPLCPLGFELRSKMVPGRCCPFYWCESKGVCVHENAEYQPGSPVYSSKCQDCVCTHEVDNSTLLNTIACTHVPCNNSCSPGFELVEAPGECCKKCEQTHCIIKRPDNQHIILKPGDFKSDPKNNCTFFSCVKIHNQLISSVSNITCPDFDPTICVPGSITFMPNGCCKTCIPRNETRVPCSTVPVTREISHAGCTKTVIMNHCSGSCGTFVMYSAEAQALDHRCSCCKEEKTSQREVVLNCPNGGSLTHTYTHIESCQCQDTVCGLPASTSRRARRSPRRLGNA